MRVAVKYCGGCNPRYDRAEIMRKLRADFPGVEVVHAGESAADVLAVVCGCPAACASCDRLPCPMKTVVLCGLSDYDRLLYPLLGTRGGKEKADELA